MRDSFTDHQGGEATMTASYDKSYFAQERKAGIVTACFRLIRDRNVSALDRFVLSLWPLYLASPVDPLPEVVLGPLGLADDAAVFARAMYLALVVAQRYRNTRR